MKRETDLMGKLRLVIAAGNSIPFSMKPSVLRFIVKILRHNVIGRYLKTDPYGWAETSDLLDVVNREFQRFTYWRDYDASKLLAVLDDNRDRIEIGKNRVRARYGHSRTVCSGVNAEPPQQLLHTTRLQLAPLILNVGLIPNQRTLVHMTTELSYAQSIHRKQDTPACVLAIDTVMCRSVSCAFFQATEHVWQTLFVPPAAISFHKGAASPAMQMFEINKQVDAASR